MAGRVVLLSSCRAPRAIARELATLQGAHDELLVAIDDAADEPGPLTLPVRWAAVREQLVGVPGAWVTPLVRSPGLPRRIDQFAALRARLGKIALLLVDSAELAAMAMPGVDVRLLPAHATEPSSDTSAGSRALVVMRAQPFHLGHLALVERALALSDEVVLVVAAAERSYAARDPFTAGERLAMVRAGLGSLLARVWLVALPAPAWPAMALTQLASIAPSFDLVVAHNPVLRALARQQDTPVTGLTEPLRVASARLSATAVRQRLVAQGAGAWLHEYLPAATAELLLSTPELAERCAMIGEAERGL